MIDLYNYSAQALRVIDGDTVELNIDLGLKVFRRESCRLSGINAPELNAIDPDVRAAAQASRDHLKFLIEGKTVFIKSKSLDKYGRPLVLIYTTDGLNVNQEMVKKGYAVVY
jgi:micrococcal nuclease